MVMDRRHYAESIMKMRLEIKNHDLLLQGTPDPLSSTREVMAAELLANNLPPRWISKSHNRFWPEFVLPTISND